MSGRRVALILAGMLPLSACVREAESVPVAVREVDGAAPELASDVVLELRAASRVDVGDDLQLALSVRNESSEALTLVRPVYGSWELARVPRYELVWTDAQGEAIADPLGFAPGLECGTLDPITRADFVRVAPGETAALRNGPSARAGHVVLPSARPGSYRLQVRYFAQGIDGASELQVLSEPISVDILGGDADAWRCRADQLAAAANHAWASVSPAGLVADGDGFWLITSDYRHRVVEHAPQHGGAVTLQRLDDRLGRVGEPWLVREGDEELGFVSVAAHGSALTLVATPGEVGGRRVEAWSVDLEHHRSGAVELVQAGPGNPYVTRVVARGERTAILHEGGDADAGALTLSFVDGSGRPLGPARRIASEVTELELLASGAEDVVAVWLQRDGIDGGVIRRFDGEGDPVGDDVRFDFDPSHSFVGARINAGELELAWADAGTRGDDPRDQMGLYARGFSLTDGHATGPTRPLSPESRSEARFGAVAWHKNQLARAVLHERELGFGIEGEALVGISSAADGRVMLIPIADGFVALWTDRRDDESNACTQLGQCVAEVYGARFGPDGAAQTGAQRLTTTARAKPFVPSDFDWQRYCP